MDEINPKVKILAQQIFDSQELDVVHQTRELINGSKKQKALAIGRLRYVLPTRPKRPLYYTNFNLQLLPMNSRFVVECMGSYLDLLIKELRFEVEGVYRKTSLGVNLDYLLKKVDEDLRQVLMKIKSLNEIVYVPSKHTYGPPNDPRHYFSNSDTVIIVLAATKLGEELKKRSNFVRNLCQDLVQPSQKQYIGNHPKTDNDGEPFDFKRKLIESSEIWSLR